MKTETILEPHFDNAISTEIISKTERDLKGLSEEERRVDALALRAEERRDKLRKATGRSKYL